MNALFKACLALIGLTSILLLSGCATAGQGTLPAGGAMTMSDIYAKETGVSSQTNQSLSAIRNRLTYQSQGNTSGANTKVRATAWGQPSPYKVRRNPEVPFYVYPHLVHNQAGTQPVPGYTSAFFLYKHNHFASPNERY